MAMTMTSTLICRVSFGKRYDEEGSEFRKFNKLLTEGQGLMGAFFVSDYFPSFSWVDKLIGTINRLDTTFKKLDLFYQELIDEHLDPNRVKNMDDVLDILIQIKEQRSCSIDLEWNNIKALLAKLSYLKAVINETLRWYPPAPMLVPRETIQNCVLEGYKIQPKTVVYINAWAIARDTEYWKNPDEFLPERFLNNNVDIKGQDFGVIPFGPGRRICPGMYMGLANVEVTVANLLYSFDWEFPPRIQAEDVDTDALPGITMHKKNALYLVPKKYDV